MAMSPQEKYEYWLDIAEYDLQTAEAMLAANQKQGQYMPNQKRFSHGC
jgi:hypothetical protein